MPTPSTKPPKAYTLRARMPLFFRVGALLGLVVVVLTIIAGLYNERSKSPFKLKGEHASLSTDVTAEVSNYERLETENGVPKYFIKADHAKTFSDNHQELQNLYLEVYSETGETSDKLSSDRALYVPEPEKNFTAYLHGNVKIDTHDALKVATENIVYTRRTQIAEADEKVEFEWNTVKGRSIGAIVKMADEFLELNREVEIETFDSPEAARSGLRYAKVNASSASFDRRNNRVEMTGGVTAGMTSRSASGAAQTTDVRADRSVIAFLRTAQKQEPNNDASSMLAGGSAQVRTMELFGNVHITSVEAGKGPTNIDAGYALYDKPADRFELRNSAHIVTTSDQKQTDIRSHEAVFERTALKMALFGAVEITQGPDLIKGDNITANLFASNRVKDAVVRGNALARQTTPERTSTITAPELNAAFDELGSMKNATAAGKSVAEIVPVNDPAYTRVDINAARGIGVSFKGAGLIDAMRTDGRTTLQLNAPNNKPDAANKRVTADAVKTVFAANGKDIATAEAVGDAELYVEPLNAGPKNYKTTITAPRFDCDFYAGNNAKSCIGGKKVRVNRAPTVTQGTNGPQVISGDQLTARFDEASHDIDSLDLVENAKYTEADRNAIGRQMTFTQADQMVRIRGGEPTVWDSRARAKAREIDLDSRANKSYLRGGVSATYYSAGQMKGSTPFGASDKPVFITAETAELDQNAETAVFTRNARGWQDNNFIRGERLFIDQRSGRLDAEGNVQSAIYNAKMRSGKQNASVPVFAAAGKLNYDRDKRLLQYRDNVDIRQGTDRITSGAADVFLDANNDVSRTVAENAVVITQPGRRATGDWVQYTSADEIAILRGNPATVSDGENGSSQAGQLSFNMRENKMASEARTKSNPTGRTRTVYKVRNP